MVTGMVIPAITGRLPDAAFMMRLATGILGLARSPRPAPITALDTK
jgi:hypothetical protein